MYGNNIDYSRGDLCLHEDENKNQQGRKTAAKHHPDGEISFRTQRIDDPAPFVRISHRETFGYVQFLNMVREE